MSNKQITKKDIIAHIRNNYANLEQSIVSQLLLETPNHHTTSGTYREQVWANFFRQIIPKKFSIAQGVFIIDSSKDNLISKEVDLAIFDEQYTPYIFNYGNIKFIPIEAVSIVVQCKSNNVSGKKNEKTLSDWVDSITKLKTNANGIARMATSIALAAPDTQKETTPIKILCAQKKCVDKDEKPKFGFDIVIYPESKKKNENDTREEKSLKVHFSEKINSLYKAYFSFNHPTNSFKDFDTFKGEMEDRIEKENDAVKKRVLKSKLDCYAELDKSGLDKYNVSDNSILSLIFQLNQLLMLINNPMLFPHQAYAEMFDKANPTSTTTHHP